MVDGRPSEGNRRRTMALEPYRFVTGRTPLLVSFPHDGVGLPDDVSARMTPEARELPDTDWHVARLYDFAEHLGASLLIATMNRYVVDLNRDPEGTSLYPGEDNTELCPTTTFERKPIYLSGQEPTLDEVAARTARYHRPYHARLSEELERLRSRFGVAVLFDAHSIRSRVPRFFEGELPVFNLGTASGKSAAPDLSERVFGVLSQQGHGLSAVRDARFKGGFITRRYGLPQEGCHALQLELAQRAYMQESPPFAFDEQLANRLRPTLKAALSECLAFTEAQR